jgi:hypothetical protein
VTTHGLSETRSFLLNDVTASEREHFEEQVLLDDAFFEDLAVAEDDLLEEFARGELEGHEEERMNRRVVGLPEWHTRVAFSRALAAVADETSEVDTDSDRLSDPTPLRTLIPSPDSLLADGGASVQKSPWLSWGAIAATLVLALAGAWFVSLVRTQQTLVGDLEVANARLVSESLDLESRLREGQTEVSSLQSELDQRATELETAQAASRELTEQLRVVQTNRTGAKASPSRATNSLTFVLGLTGLRGEERTPPRVLSQEIDQVNLQLDLEGDTDYSAFRVLVTNPFGEEIWSQDEVPLVEHASGGMVELTLPAKLLQSGRYEIAVSGHRQGGLRDVGFYALEIAAR